VPFLWRGEGNQDSLFLGTAGDNKKGVIFHNPRFSLYFFGGAEGDRTPDLMNAIHALSQLSYSPIGKKACRMKIKITKI
jgi:hypothetical protein